MRNGRLQLRGIVGLSTCAAMSLVLQLFGPVAYAQEAGAPVDDACMTMAAPPEAERPADVTEGQYAAEQQVVAPSEGDVAEEQDLAEQDADERTTQAEDVADAADDTEADAGEASTEASNDKESDQPADLDDLAVADEQGALTSAQALEAMSGAPKNGWYTPDEGGSYYY
ncbi:MAG: hypothetical protein J6D34_05065, partial [Atopobiaceae bacterium]|nr:hypothetical protein [Atopobiaceae bacterium]